MRPVVIVINLASEGGLFLLKALIYEPLDMNFVVIFPVRTLRKAW